MKSQAHSSINQVEKSKIRQFEDRLFVLLFTKANPTEKAN
jgi:hypothetical protein